MLNVIRMNNYLSILLATYNGESYVTEQIESLLAQTYQNFQLYIRDDGSTDHTEEIIKSYAKRYPTKIFVVPDSIKHRGAMESFFYMLGQIDSFYYMFCDQDDVWLPNKIELTLSKMEEFETKWPNIPIVVHTDLYVVDKNLDIIYPSFWRLMKLKVNLLQRYEYMATCNCVTGCTMLFNNLSKRVSIPPPVGATMHDYWIALATAMNGLVINIAQPTVLYRQHGKNVVGIQDRSLKYFIRKIFHIRNTLKSLQRQMKFCKCIGYGSICKFLYYKILYTVRRNF